MSTPPPRQPPAYAAPEKLFPMLGIPDTGRTAILHDLDLVCEYANSYADRILRQKLGKTNSAGNPVRLPLTPNTRPPLTQSFLQNVYRLAEAYWRFRQSDDSSLWEDAVEQFEKSADEEFGYAWSTGHVVSVGLTVSPNPSLPGAPVELRGVNFRGLRGITVSAEDGPAPELPDVGDAFSDEMGDWTAAAVAPTADKLNGRKGATIMLTASDGSLYDGPTRRITVPWRVQVQEGGSQ